MTVKSNDILRELRQNILARSHQHQHMMWEYRKDKLKETVENTKTMVAANQHTSYPFVIKPFSE